MKSEKRYAEAAKDEISLLRAIQLNDERCDFIVQLLDDFSITGPNGTHTCLVFEVLGESLLQLLLKENQGAGLAIPTVKKFSKQILLGLDWLHRRCKIIHTDLKPENVLLHQTEPVPSVKIVDLGNGCWCNKHFTNDIQTRQYRSPEVILEYGYSTSADIWSFACVVFEMLTGDVLFQPKGGKNFCLEEDHLAQMIELIGDFPPSLTRNGRLSGEFFNPKGELRGIPKRNLRVWRLKQVLVEKYHFAKEEAAEITQFLLPALEFDPTLRTTAAHALKSKWLSDVS